MAPGIASAPGKVILVGEHSVVYGYPAIVAAIGLRCRVEATYIPEGLEIIAKDLETTMRYTPDQLSKVEAGQTIHKSLDNIAMAAIQVAGTGIGARLVIRSQIPVGAGLGSSAAVSVATIAALSDLLDREYSEEQISQMAYTAEQIAHGTPSGIDNSIATFGGLLRFCDGKIATKPTTDKIPLLVIDTRVPRNTRELVTGVRERKENYPGIMKPTLEAMGQLADQFELAFDQHDLYRMGEIFKINQGLLDAIGVGHEQLSKTVWEALRYGALGAKLTGAGGGGCLIVLARDYEQAKDLSNQLDNGMLDIYLTEISPEGVRIGD